MRAGWLRHRVTLQEPAAPYDQDTSGAALPGFDDVATVWAGVRTVGGSEQPVSSLEAVVARVIHRVQVRYPLPGDVMPREDWRVVWSTKTGPRTLEVTAVLEPDNRQRMLNLECVEVLR